MTFYNFLLLNKYDDMAFFLFYMANILCPHAFKRCGFNCESYNLTMILFYLVRR